MVQKTVLKVDISCQKCKKKLLKAVSGLRGVDKVEIDGSKGTLTVTGEADPYEIILRTRQAGKFAEVVSIGPPRAPPKPDAQKKPDDKKPDQKAQTQAQDHVQAHLHNPYTCPVCQGMTVVHVPRWEEPNPSCSIM